MFLIGGYEIDGVVLDCDGTMVDTTPHKNRCYAAAYAESGFMLTEEMAEAIDPGADATRNHANTQAAFRKAGRIVADDEAGLIRRRVNEIYRSTLADVQDIATRGIRKFLDRCERHENPTAVVSNGTPSNFMESMRAGGILDHFRVRQGQWKIPGSEEYRIAAPAMGWRPKPDPEMPLGCIHAWGQVPGRGLFVGDTRADSEAARRSGMIFAAVTANAKDPQAAVQMFRDLGAQIIVSDFEAMDRLIAQPYLRPTVGGRIELLL
jgi:beta-phosphoglucomutase-like phosphatase (HAD superfamily)